MSLSSAAFEKAARDQNHAKDLAVASARASGSPCVVVDMLAFGGVPYCTAHRVMGECPYAAKPTSEIVSAPAGLSAADEAAYRKGIADAISPPTQAEIESAPFVPLTDAYAAGYKAGRAAMRKARKA